MSFVIQTWIIGALNAAKRGKNGQNEGEKYKIINFQGNFPFGTLQIHKCTEKMVVQGKQYKKCTL